MRADTGGVGLRAESFLVFRTLRNSWKQRRGKKRKKLGSEVGCRMSDVGPVFRVL